MACNCLFSLFLIGAHVLSCCVLLPSGSSGIYGFQYRKESYQILHCAKTLCWAAVREIWTVICTLNIIHCWFLDDCLLVKEAGRWFFYAQLMAFPFITVFLRGECTEINLHILKDEDVMWGSELIVCLNNRRERERHLFENFQRLCWNNN